MLHKCNKEGMKFGRQKAGDPPELNFLFPCSGELAAGHGQGGVGDHRHISEHHPDPGRVGTDGHQQGHSEDVSGQQPV